MPHRLNPENLNYDDTKVRMSVNGSGRLDVYQWLYFLAQHAARHIDQMRETEAEWKRLRN